MARIKSFRSVTVGTKMDTLFKRIKKMGFAVDETSKHIHFFYADGYKDIDYNKVKIVLPYHKNTGGVKYYHKDEVEKAIQDVRDIESAEGVSSSLNEDAIDYLRRDKMTKLEKIKGRYDMSERKNVFGERNRYMRGIEYLETYKGHDIYSFYDTYYGPEVSQICCPTLNICNDDEGYEGDFDSMLKDLKRNMDIVIKDHKRYANGIIHSNVLGKDVRV